MKRLEPGENESIVFEGIAHDFRHFNRQPCINPGFKYAERFGNHLACFRSVQHGRIKPPRIIDHAGSVKECRIVKIGARIAFCKAQEVVAIQVAQSTVKRAI